MKANPMLPRRTFLQQAGVSVGAWSIAAAAPPKPPKPQPEPRADERFRPEDWASVRAQFPLASSYIHMAMFYLASHPRPVAEAIERYRRALDENPTLFAAEHNDASNVRVSRAAAQYMGGDAEYIALTDSTTMGLGLVYGGLDLAPGDEIVSTTHDHYSTQMSLRHRADRTGAKVIEVSLYDEPATASVNEIVARMRKAVTPATRVLAVTWVHSGTGVKLPLAAMGEALREINASREARHRVLFCVDGVHGFGIERENIDELGCDFFVAGTHKWIFGPRGTGVIWGRPDAWKSLRPIIPSFGRNYEVWLGGVKPDEVAVGDLMTPGGFHSFEHRWALDEAFRFHLQIGKARVQKRIHSLNTLAKEALVRMPHVKLHTPLDPGLSAGIICFEVNGLSPLEVVARLHERGIIASKSPYRTSYVRIAPSLINNEEEVERTLREIRALV